jgi:methylthioribose-1-phosphate isomerase
MNVSQRTITPIAWVNGRVRFLDQTRLPSEIVYRETEDELFLAEAIKRLAIRAAPLIGIAAAYGLVLAMNKLTREDLPARRSAFDRAYALLASTRPTAVNLFWALNRMCRTFQKYEHLPIESLQELLLAEARAIHDEDASMCERISVLGAALLPVGAAVLTHCNTGRLATGGKGTALGILETAWEQNKIKHVYIDETRPLLQGSRLTAWELSTLGIPATLIVDSAAGFLMQRGLVDAVLVGADRIVANGDVANKIGTYSLALLARHHHLPFYVAAPATTIDFSLTSGASIPIEQRQATELFWLFDNDTPAAEVDCYNPAFDVTPHELISALITDVAVIESPTPERMLTIRTRLETERTRAETSR